MKDIERPPRPQFKLASAGKSSWRIRIEQALTFPLRRIGPAFVCYVTLYLAFYNIGVRLWKGPEHPVNRFRWRLMENSGSLSPDLISKKETVKKYYTSKLNGEI